MKCERCDGQGCFNRYECDEYCCDAPCNKCMGTGEIEDEEQKMKWISVKDRLPEQNQEVLICYDGCLDFGSYDIRDGEICWIIVGRFVEPSHWMPLPDMPEDCEEEEENPGNPL